MDYQEAKRVKGGILQEDQHSTLYLQAQVPEVQATGEPESEPHWLVTIITRCPRKASQTFSEAARGQSITRNYTEKQNYITQILVHEHDTFSKEIPTGRDAALYHRWQMLK